MQRNEVELTELYETLWNTFVEYEQLGKEVNTNWSLERRNMYKFGPVIGKYLEKDKQLYAVISQKWVEKDVQMMVKPEIQRQVNIYKSKSNVDVMSACKYESYLKQAELLEDDKVGDWIEKYFMSYMTFVCGVIDANYIYGVCIVYYGYLHYCSNITSIYNSDMTYVKRLYEGIYGKASALYTYNLIPIDAQCELMAIDPPRVYDGKINKTFYLANISKELLNTLIVNHEICGDVSVRVANIATKIFDGKYTLESIMEAVQFGKIFSVQNLDRDFVTKLYSESYKDCLWIKVDSSNITFEELCEREQSFNDAIITQVIHLEYEKENTGFFITHLDHEYIFYSKEEYELRQTDASIKGEAQKRLKSFKLDGARIPIDLPCKRSVNVPGESMQEVKFVTEEVPFLVLVLKSYFKHTDLIDEYFEKII